MSFIDDDITHLFDDLDSKEITFGLLKTRCYQDSAEELVLQQDNRGGVIVNAIVVTFKTADLPGLAVGSTISINGASKTVRQRLKVDDGLLTKILCSG